MKHRHFFLLQKGKNGLTLGFRAKYHDTLLRRFDSDQTPNLIDDGSRFKRLGEIRIDPFKGGALLGLVFALMLSVSACGTTASQLVPLPETSPADTAVVQSGKHAASAIRSLELYRHFADLVAGERFIKFVIDVKKKQALELILLLIGFIRDLREGE